MNPTYSLALESGDGISPTQRQAAEQLFRGALEATLGDASLVVPIYMAYLQLVVAYGETPDMDVLSDAEREIWTHWQAAESAATIAAFGPNRYLDEPRFDIVMRRA